MQQAAQHDKGPNSQQQWMLGSDSSCDSNTSLQFLVARSALSNFVSKQDS